MLGRTLGLSPLAVLIGMLFWGWLYGAGGSAAVGAHHDGVAKITLENVEGLSWVARIMGSVRPRSPKRRPSAASRRRSSLLRPSVAGARKIRVAIGDLRAPGLLEDLPMSTMLISTTKPHQRRRASRRCARERRFSRHFEGIPETTSCSVRTSPSLPRAMPFSRPRTPGARSSWVTNAFSAATTIRTICTRPGRRPARLVQAGDRTGARTAWPCRNRYPAPRSGGGGFEERYWSPLNSPLMGPDGKVAYIIHRVEDVTEFVRLKQRGLEQARRTEELKTRAERARPRSSSRHRRSSARTSSSAGGTSSSASSAGSRRSSS